MDTYCKLRVKTYFTLICLTSYLAPINALDEIQASGVREASVDDEHPTIKNGAEGKPSVDLVDEGQNALVISLLEKVHTKPCLVQTLLCLKKGCLTYRILALHLANESIAGIHDTILVVAPIQEYCLGKGQIE